MSPDNSCHACDKSDGKLLRCGRCKSVWFCNRDCQIAAARQGYSGANCRPADEAHVAAGAEAAPRVPDVAGPSITAPGVHSASLVPAASSCHACGKSDGKLGLTRRRPATALWVINDCSPAGYVLWGPF